MLTSDYYEGCADDVIELYEQLEDDIISDIVCRMMKTDFVTESVKHQAEMIRTQFCFMMIFLLKFQNTLMQVLHM